MLSVRPLVRWRRQPPAGFGVDWSNPVTRGLEFALYGNLKRDAVSGAATAVTGTKLATVQPGRALGFYTTVGAGASDAVGTAYVADRTQRSYLVYANRIGAGDGDLGRVFDKSASATYNDTLAYDNGSNWYAYGRIFSGSSASWGFTAQPTNTWQALLLTYDASVAANTPAFYVNGVSQAASVIVAPSGTVTSNSHSLIIGNRYDGIRTFNGYIALVAEWNRILRPDEIAALSANPWQLFAPTSVPRFYLLASSAPITITPATAPGGTVGIAYSAQLSASGGASPYTFSISSGSLPRGLTLSSAGLLAGTPTGAGTFVFTITATDANNITGSEAYALIIAHAASAHVVARPPWIAISPSYLVASLNMPFSVALHASGGTPPYRFSVVARDLPPGMSLTVTGILSGTPRASGRTRFTVTATDSAGNSGTATMRMAVS